MKKIVNLIICIVLVAMMIVCVASCQTTSNNSNTTDGSDNNTSNDSSNDSHVHNYGEWGEDTATCEKDGTQTKVCQTCGKEKSRTTLALGHDYVSMSDKAPTCTEAGYSNYKKCSRCDSSEGEIFEPTGHKMSEWKNNTATCLQGGIEESLCENNCGFREERATSALGHDINTYGECTGCHKRDILILVENGVAKFNVVVTTKASGNGMAMADMFISDLRALGVEIGDAVMDTDMSSVSEYEIIIGAGAENRGEACCITEKQLGTNGSIVKIVGNKIIIAGGTASITTTAFNKFISEDLGISSDLKSIDYLEVDSSCCYEYTTEYTVNSIKIAGNDLGAYSYVLDVSQASSYGITDIAAFHDKLFALSGYYLGYVSASSMTESGKYFVIRCVDYAGEEGFRAFVDGDDFIVECAYKNMFNDAFAEFAKETFLSKTGNLSFDTDFLYEKKVNVVYYEDFGAVGDGFTCDFEAIYNTHKFANAGGQKVLSKLGEKATYYISAEKFTKTIPVCTDVDFCGATFLVNDVGESAYKYRKLALFTLARDYGEYKYTDSEKNVLEEYIDEATGEVMQKYVTDGIIDFEAFQGITISVGESEFEWLAPYLQGKSLVKIENKLHKDFVRHGSNQNSGATRRDIFIVNQDGSIEVVLDEDGNVVSDTRAVFEFDNISTIEIYRADEKEITVENGNFINICCRTVASTKYVINGADDDPNNDIATTYANKFHEYQRGFIVYRSNATIKNVKHTMEKEPDLGWYPEGCGYTPDGKHYNTNGNIAYGSRHESYPYYGFVFVTHSYNFTLEDSQLAGHTTYYEDKPATASTGWKIPNPVPMGTYDFVLEYSSNVTFKNVIQVNKKEQLTDAENGDFTYLTDTRYWGIMSSNGTKNLTFDGCSINRFDAHRGFWNAKIVDTYIGHSLQVIGGGTLYVENVTKAAKSNFMTFRGDYGATFEGDVIIKNCTHESRKTYSSWTGSPQAKGSETTAYIMDSGFEVYNYGYSTGEDGYLGGYWYWDFGYLCYMPINVTIDNYTSHAKYTYVYDDLPDIIFENTYVEGEIPGKFTVRNVYQITKTITQLNMSAAIPTCKGTWQRNTTNGYKDYPKYYYTKLKAIPVTLDGVPVTFE